MKQLRWYDKDPVLKEFMGLLETLDPQTVDILAQDFIQVIMDSGFTNVDSTIDLLNKNSPNQFNRWYDKNYNLHSCIELLKNLPQEQKVQLIESFKESFFHLITNIYYEKENE